MLVCRFVRFFGCSLISHELLDKTYICAHHQNGLNEEIKIMFFICRFNVYFSRNQRKCSQNDEDKIYEVKDVSSCRAGNSEYNSAFYFSFQRIFLP